VGTGTVAAVDDAAEAKLDLAVAVVLAVAVGLAAVGAG